MLKVFLIGFLCVALTHQASIGENLQGRLGKAQDQAKSLTGQQRALRSTIDDVAGKASSLTRQQRLLVRSLTNHVQKPASNLAGKQRSLRSLTGDLSQAIGDVENSASNLTGLRRKKRQFQMFGVMMSE